ncbi:MAG: hypothetical protein D6710_04625 [Nitrospirae bacterium]|nr:MAG: hypothetical protein D6710_04625 [Nitrospirota bacterium]
MKAVKMIIVSAIMVTLLFSAVGVKKAEAMNNESAALLAGAIVLFGKPILNAIAQDVFYPEPVRVYHEKPRRVIYKKVYVIKHERDDDCYKPCFGPRNAYEKGWCDEWRRLERRDYRRGRRDARRYYYRYYDDP